MLQGEILGLFVLALLNQGVLSMSTLPKTREKFNNTDIGFGSSAIQFKIQPQETFSSRAVAVDPRKFGGEESFVNHHWKVWDRPEDQLAIESASGPGPGPEVKGKLKPSTRKSKNFISLPSATHFNGNSTEVSYQNHQPQPHLRYLPPGVTYSGAADNTVTQRQDCNGNLQVSFFPVILVLVSAIVGLITIVVVWFIARKWLVVEARGTGTGGHTPSSGNSYQSGWSSQQRFYDGLTGFSRSLKNIDFDQLTTLVTNGIEIYKQYFDKS